MSVLNDKQMIGLETERSRSREGISASLNDPEGIVEVGQTFCLRSMSGKEIEELLNK